MAKAKSSRSSGAQAKTAVAQPIRHSIGSYLIQRLQDYGVRDVFGIPGDFVLQFYGMLEDSPVRVIGTTNEACAGYAADGYARINGIGAVCVTYCVGGLSLCNAVAGAYAEKSPVIVISGSPGMSERRSDPLLHHRVKDFNTQREVFEKITIASASLEDELTAFREIDRCLAACVRFKRPVFLELPRDKVMVVPDREHHPLIEHHLSDSDALKEALSEARESIKAAKKPVIIAGIELHRFGLQNQVLQFADFMNAVADKKFAVKRPAPKVRHAEIAAWKPANDAAVTIKRLFQKINSVLDENLVVIADTGDSLFAAADLSITKHTEFLSTAYYTSMGFAVPASVGVQVANRQLRPLVLVGDGAFQMTCMELSTTVRHKFNPIVVVLNNKGYSTERFIQEGPFNDIHNWQYHKMPELLGAGWGFEVRTEGDLEKAFKAAFANQDSFSLLNVHLDKLGVSPALKRLAERLATRL